MQCLVIEDKKMFQEGGNIQSKAAETLSKIKTTYRPYNHGIYQHGDCHYP